MKKLISNIRPKISDMSDSAKSGIIYTLSTLLTKGLVFLTIPIFTRIMSPSQIGVTNIYNSWFSLICILSTLSLTSGGYQLALKEFDKEKDKYESSVFSLTCLIAIVVLIVYLIGMKYWDALLEMPHKMIFMLIIGLFVSPAQDFWMARQRFEYKYKASSIITFFTTLLAVVFSVYLVLNCNPEEAGWFRLLGNNLIVYGVGFILGIYIITRGRTFYNRKYWLFSLSLSIPLVGHAIAKQILDVSDRIMINRFVGENAVGIYSTLYSVSTISLIAWNAINGAFVPYLFKNIDNENEYNNIKRISSLLLFLYTILAFFIILLAPEIVKVMATGEYSEAVYIMPPIAMGVSLTAVSNLYSNILIFYKKTKIIMVASFIAAIVNVGLNAFTIPVYGYQAAAYTTLIAYIIMALIESVVATVFYKKVNSCQEMIYDNRLIITLCMSTIVLSFISIWLYKVRVIRYFICMICIVMMCLLCIKRKKFIK